MRINPRVFVFLFFLIIATIFWFLSALSKNYTTTVAYPLGYENFPEDKILVGELPEHLEVQLRGYGFTLLQIKMGMGVEPLPFSVSDLSMVPKSGKTNNTYYYLTDFSRDKIARALPADVNVLKLKPDSIIFQFDEMASKTVPVDKDAFAFNYRRQFMQTGPVSIKPDSVKLWGAKSRLDTILSIAPAKKTFNDLHEPLNTDVDLQQLADIRVKPEKVHVELPVSEFTEKTLRIEVAVRNLPGDTNIKLFPDNVKVTFLVGLQQYSHVKTIDFRAVVDYEDMRSGISNKVRVHLTEKPEYIDNIRIYPEYLEYIIEK